MKFNKKIILLFIIEIFFLAICLRRAIRQPISIDLDKDDFLSCSLEGTYVDSNGLHTKGGSGTVALGERFTVHSGAAYEVFIKYSFDSEKSLGNACAIAFSLNDGEFNSLKLSDIFLYHGSDQAYGRVYADGGGDAQLVFKYMEGEWAVLESVKIVERPLWQWIKIVFLLVFFGIIDVCSYKIDIIKKLDTKNVCILSLIILCAIPCILDFQFGGHDLIYHMQRIANVAKELADGQIPVRIYSYVYNGYGYGAPLFYGDIFLYLPALLYNLMVPLYVCIQLYIFFISLITVFTSYYCFRYISNNDKIALVCSFLWCFSPYRICCIWVRGAFGEYTALAFLPLILWGMYAIWSEENYSFRNSIILGSGVALTTLCHILSVELSLVPLILSVILLHKKISMERIKGVLVAILVFFGLTAWFIIPMADSVMNLGIKAFNSTIEKAIQDSGIYLIQLLNPFYSYGGANVDRGMTQEMPLSLGIGASAGLVLTGFYWIDKKRNGKTISKRLSVLWILGTVVTFMTTIYFPWNYLSRMGGDYLAKWMNEGQFTWRYMGIASLLLISTFGELLVEINNDAQSEIVRRIVTCICSISIIATSVFFKDYVNIQDEYRTYAYWNYSKGYLLTFFAIDADT